MSASSSSSTAAINAPQRTRRRWPWITSGVVVLLVTAWFAWDAVERKKLDEARAAFAAHGLPTKLEEVVPPAVLDEENAAPLIDEIAALLKTPGASAAVNQLNELLATRSKGSDGLFRFSEEQQPKLGALFSTPEIKQILNLAHDASLRGTFAPNKDYHNPVALLLPELATIRTVVQLLGAHSTLDPLRGAEKVEPWEDFETARRLARHVGRVPTLICTLTEIAVIGITEHDELVCVADQKLSPNLGALLARRLSELAEFDRALQRGYNSERVITVAWAENQYLIHGKNWIDDYATMAGGNESALKRTVRSWLSPLVRPIARPFLYADLRQTYEIELKSALALRERGNVATAMWREIESGEFVVLMPFALEAGAQVSKLARTHAFGCARERLILTLLTALKYHRDSRNWPADSRALDLPEDAATDPCSGLPIVFRERGGELLIYAFGPDGDDDGGREPATRADLEKDGDIAIRVRPKLPLER